jgi:hypothetical protein
VLGRCCGSGLVLPVPGEEMEVICEGGEGGRGKEEIEGGGGCEGSQEVVWSGGGGEAARWEV